MEPMEPTDVLSPDLRDVMEKILLPPVLAARRVILSPDLLAETEKILLCPDLLAETEKILLCPDLLAETVETEKILLSPDPVASAGSQYAASAGKPGLPEVLARFADLLAILLPHFKIVVHFSQRNSQSSKLNYWLNSG